MTDLSWNPSLHSLLASSSIDGHIRINDVREGTGGSAVNLESSLAVQKVIEILAVGSLPKTVVFSLWTQITWHRRRSNFLLSAHEGDLRLWDLRAPAQPLHYATAHASAARILSLNWSGGDGCSSGSRFVTSGSDCTVKFWDFDDDGEEEEPFKLRQTLKTAVPVWRAK